MGANTSSQDIETFKKNVTDASVEIMNRTLSYSDNSALASASQKVIIEGAHICGGVTISQGTVVENRVFNSMSDIQESELQTELQNRMEDIINTTLQQTQSNFVLGQVNKTDIESSTRQEVYNDLSTTIAKETKQMFNNQVSAVATQDITLRDSYLTCVEGLDGQGFTVKQDINLTNVVENAMNSTKVDEAITNATNELTFEETTDVTQDIEGTSPLEALAGLVTAAMVPIIAGVVGVVVFAIIIAILVIGIKSKGFKKVELDKMFKKK